MDLRLADLWWKGVLVAVTGVVLLVLNARALWRDQVDPIAVVSVASAAFVTALGFALTVQRRDENV